MVPFLHSNGSSPFPRQVLYVHAYAMMKSLEQYFPNTLLHSTRNSTVNNILRQFYDDVLYNTLASAKIVAFKCGFNSIYHLMNSCMYVQSK